MKSDKIFVKTELWIYQRLQQEFKTAYIFILIEVYD